MRVSNPLAVKALYTSGAGRHKDRRKGKGGARNWRDYLEEWDEDESQEEIR